MLQNKKIRFKHFKIIVSFLLILILTISGTFAVNTANKGIILPVNLGDVDIEIKDDTENTADVNNNSIYDNNENLLGGMQIKQAPYITNTGTINEWVYAIITIPAININNYSNYGDIISHKTQIMSNIKAIAIQDKYYNGDDYFSIWKTYKSKNNLNLSDLSVTNHTIPMFTLKNVNYSQWTNVDSFSDENNYYYIYAFQNKLAPLQYTAPIYQSLEVAEIDGSNVYYFYSETDDYLNLTYNNSIPSFENAELTHYDVKNVISNIPKTDNFCNNDGIIQWIYYDTNKIVNENDVIGDDTIIIGKKISKQDLNNGGIISVDYRNKIESNKVFDMVVSTTNNVQDVICKVRCVSGINKNKETTVQFNYKSNDINDSYDDYTFNIYDLIADEEEISNYQLILQSSIDSETYTVYEEILTVEVFGNTILNTIYTNSISDREFIDAVDYFKCDKIISILNHKGCPLTCYNNGENNQYVVGNRYSDGTVPLNTRYINTEDNTVSLGNYYKNAFGWDIYNTKDIKIGAGVYQLDRYFYSQGILMYSDSYNTKGTIAQTKRYINADMAKSVFANDDKRNLNGPNYWVLVPNGNLANAVFYEI